MDHPGGISNRFSSWSEVEHRTLEFIHCTGYMVHHRKLILVNILPSVFCFLFHFSK